jgi:hypothetical protein
VSALMVITSAPTFFETIILFRQSSKFGRSNESEVCRIEEDCHFRCRRGDRAKSSWSDHKYRSRRKNSFSTQPSSINIAILLL